MEPSVDGPGMSGLLRHPRIRERGAICGRSRDVSVTTTSMDTLTGGERGAIRGRSRDVRITIHGYSDKAFCEQYSMIYLFRGKHPYTSFSAMLSS